MNKCRNCGFWRSDAGDHGICDFLAAALDFGERIQFCEILKKWNKKLPIKSVDIVTCADFGCVHFEEKDQRPFSIVKSDGGMCGFDYWHLAFGKEKGPTIFRCEASAVMWQDWLNELWAQMEQEPPGKNCPDCTSFPCRTHQFFTGHARFCCDKFDRRSCSTCKHDDEDLLFCGEHAFVCGRWAQNEKELLDKNCRFECKTCSFWKDKHPFSDGVWGACEYAEMKKSLPVHCGKAIAGGAFSDTKNCTLHTREDFGCNQWADL